MFAPKGTSAEKQSAPGRDNSPAPRRPSPARLVPPAGRRPPSARVGNQAALRLSEQKRNAAAHAEQGTAPESAAADGAPLAIAVPPESSGQPLSSGARAYLEGRFHRNFSGVRVHHDAAAARSAESLQANAYACGQDIYFAAGQYQPETAAGIKLLAHELAHTVQPRATVAGPHALQERLPISSPGDASERQARQVASQVVANRPLGAITAHRASISRDKRTGAAPAYSCSGATLDGTSLILHGNAGDIPLKAKPLDLPSGTYAVWAVGTNLKIKFENESQKVLEYSWDLATPQEDILFAYLASMKSGSPVSLQVVDASAGQSGEGGAGGAARQGSGSETPHETPGEGSQGGTKEGQPGQTGAGSADVKQQPTTGTQGGQKGEGQKGGGQGPDIYAKLQSILDAPQPPKDLTPDQVKRLKEVLDQLSPEDIEVFKRFSVKNPGGDVEGLIHSLQLFQSQKDLYKKELERQEPAPPPEEDQKILADAMKQYRNDMTPVEKEAWARATVRAVSNRQLKSLTPAQIAKSIIRVDRQLTGMADDMSGGLDKAIEDSGWGRVAGISRAVKGASSFWAFLSSVALIAAAFVPGLNVAVLAASALAAGMVAFAAAGMQEEAEIQQATRAKSADDAEKHVAGAAQARTEQITTGIGLAIPVVTELIGKIPIPTKFKQLGAAIPRARGLLKQGAADAIESSRKLALDALEKFRGDLHPYASQVRQSIAAVVKRLRGAKDADFIQAVSQSPELQELLPPDTVKALKGLSDKQAHVAQDAIYSGLDNAPQFADELFQSVDQQIADAEQKIRAARTPQELDAALDESARLMDPQKVSQRATEEGLERTAASRIAELGDLTVDNLKVRLMELEGEVSQLPPANSERAGALGDLKRLAEQLVDLERKQQASPGAIDISRDLEAIGNRMDEIDNLMAGDIMKSMETPGPPGPDAPPDPDEFAQFQKDLDQHVGQPGPEGQGPVKGQKMGTRDPSQPPTQPKPRKPRTPQEIEQEQKLVEKMAAETRQQALERLNDVPDLKAIAQADEEVAQMAEHNPSLLRERYQEYLKGRAKGEIKSKTLGDYLRIRRRADVGGIGEFTKAFELGPDEILIKAPKQSPTAPGTDFGAYNPKSDRITWFDNKAVKQPVSKVSALEKNLRNNLADDIAEIQKWASQPGVPPEVAQRVLPRMQAALNDLDQYIAKYPRLRPYSQRTQKAFTQILEKHGIDRVVTTSYGGPQAGVTSGLKEKGFTTKK